MDRDQSIWEFLLDGAFEPIADVVSGTYTHAPRHYQMEINKHRAARLPCAKIMCLDRTFGVGGNDLADTCQSRGWNRLIHQAADGFLH
jgi:hypothetical protein